MLVSTLSPVLYLGTASLNDIEVPPIIKCIKTGGVELAHAAYQKFMIS